MAAAAAAVAGLGAHLSRREVAAGLRRSASEETAHTRYGGTAAAENGDNTDGASRASRAPSQRAGVRGERREGTSYPVRVLR